MYLLNSLPARLLARGVGSRFSIEVISQDEALDLCESGDVFSAIGHEDFAERLSGLLGIFVPKNRVTLERIPDDGALVANVVMPKRRGESDPNYSHEALMAMPINWLLIKPKKD